MNQHYVGDTNWDYFQHFGDQLLSDELSAQSATKINRHLRPAEKLADFGCSAGRITRLLNAQKRVGIEISQTAGRVAREKSGIDVVTDVRALADGDYDAVVTHHALEHVESPFSMLREFHRILKPGGQLIAVVPGETGWYKRSRTWRDEVNKHLYTWTPLTFGNLVSEAGFHVEQAHTLRYEHESPHLGPFKSLSLSRKLMGWARQLLQGETEVLVVATRRSA